MAGGPHEEGPPSPAGRVIRGPSYPRTARLVATALMAALAAWLSRIWPALAAASWQPEAVAFLVAVGAVVVAGYWAVLTSETSIDERVIRQTAPWRKEVALADITQVKLVRIAGLDALVVPRLVVRSRGLGFTTFTAGDARLVQAFRALAQAAPPPPAPAPPP
ncbi:MAG: hypothetical protein JNL85_06870 [Rubrivivax sp.]|nr:hypothetical protein [Rubrivivax sp.]